MDPASQEAAGLGSVLRGFRQAAGLTQRELAGRAGLSVGVVRDLEQGRTRYPSDGTLAGLVAALGLNSAQAAELRHAAAGRGLWLRILGSLAVWRDGLVVSVGGQSQRAVLGLLALSAGSVVHRDRIMDVLWPSGPPASAVSIVQTRLSRIRKALGGGDQLLPAAGASYRLRVGPGQLDLLRFQQLADEARAADSRADHATACRHYSQAIGLWHGDPLADVELLRDLPAVIGLARQRTEVVVSYARATSAVGRYGEAVSLLRDLAAHEPLNEQAQAELMLALASSGHQAEALDVYHALCRRLDDELGMPPGPDLASAYQRVLRQEVPVTRATAAVAGAATAPSVVPRQLPARTRQFVGRFAELTALSALLDDPGGTARAVLISAVGGTAGVGKTALAVHWAHQVSDRFPDGQLYADLSGWGPSAEPVPPEDLISRFLTALGVPADRMPGDAGARQGLYRSLLASKRVLIVLDNARDAAQVRPLLPGDSSSVVLITSRRQLASLVALEAAHPVALDVLTAAEARELLARRLGPERVAAEPGAAAELTELCARLPLALAIAASRAALRPATSLATLVSALRDASGRLAVLDAGDDVSVEAVFSWSYRQLPEPDRRMFRLLGIHPGPDISAAAAASLSGTGLVQVRELLGRLAEASLLTEYLPGRFRFHDLLRAYAATCASADGDLASQRAAIHRMLDHYLQSTAAGVSRLGDYDAAVVRPDPPRPGVTPEGFSDIQQAIAWFKAEQAVLTAVAGLAVSAGFDTYGWQLPLMLGPFYDRIGNSGKSLALQEAGLAAARRLDDKLGQLLLHNRIGGTCVRLGACTDAEYHYQRGLNISLELGDPAREAGCRLGLGFVADHQGRNRDALAHCLRALALARPEDGRPFYGAVLGNTGWCHAQVGEYEQALPYIRQALEIQRETGDTTTEAYTCDSLGYVQRNLGRHADAIASYEQALALFRQADARADEAVTLDYLGDAHLAAGHSQLAVRAWQQSVTILHELEDPRAGEVRGKLQRALD